MPQLFGIWRGIIWLRFIHLYSLFGPTSCLRVNNFYCFCKLQMFGIPIIVPVNIFCENESIYNNSIFLNLPWTRKTNPFASAFINSWIGMVSDFDRIFCLWKFYWRVINFIVVVLRSTGHTPKLVFRPFVWISVSWVLTRRGFSWLFHLKWIKTAEKQFLYVKLIVWMA